METTSVFGNSAELKKIFNTGYLNKPVCDLSAPLKEFIAEYRKEETTANKQSISFLVIKEHEDGRKTKASQLRAATPEELEHANNFMTCNLNKYKDYVERCAALSKVKYRLNCQVGHLLDFVCSTLVRDLYKFAASYALSLKLKMVRVKHLYSSDKLKSLDSFLLIGSLPSFVAEYKRYEDKLAEEAYADKLKQAILSYKKDLKATHIVKLKDGVTKPVPLPAAAVASGAGLVADVSGAEAPELHKKWKFNDVIISAAKYVKNLPECESVKFGSDLHSHVDELLSDLFATLSSTIVRALKLFNGKTVSVDVLKFALSEVVSRNSGLLEELCELKVQQVEDNVTIAKLRTNAKNNGEKFNKKSVPFIDQLTASREIVNEPKILKDLSVEMSKQLPATQKK